MAIVEPKYTFLSWEAKPQFFIKGPIKKRKGGFFPYSICLAGLFFCIFFLKFFVFFVCTHWEGHCPGNQKKKMAGRFFPDAIWPLGHKCPVGQCEDGSCQKKKKGFVLPRPHPILAQSGPYPLNTPLCKIFFQRPLGHYRRNVHIEVDTATSYRLKKRAFPQWALLYQSV